MNPFIFLILTFAILSLSTGTNVDRLRRTTTTEKPTRVLEDLYQEALAEGGRVIVYAGGDTAGSQDMFKNAFEKRFPNMTADVICDLSKYHDARIDLQLETDTLIPDVVSLQTLQDFPRWKAQGVLMQYKPIDWDQVYDEFKDPEGYYTAILVDSFSNVISKKVLPDESTWPRDGADYLRPEFKSKIIATYPNDDDAVLHWYKMMVDKYGWSYIQQFVAQQPHLVRGTNEPYKAVDRGDFPVAAIVDASLKPQEGSDVVFALPREDPFVAWPQMAAIFKNAKRPAAAKLWMSWYLSREAQEDTWYMWSVRKDVSAPSGFKNVFDYHGQMDPLAFGKWMADREAVEQFRTKIMHYFGEVKGEASPGYPGLHPEHALPH